MCNMQYAMCNVQSANMQCAKIKCAKCKYAKIKKAQHWAGLLNALNVVRLMDSDDMIDSD